MSLAELVITSVKVEGRSKSEVARDYRISRYWVQQLVARYEAEGTAAFQPRSRRPHTNPRALPPELEDRIVRLRKELSKQGWDAGASTIRIHLQRGPTLTRIPSTSTIWRILTRRGFVTPQPRKRPKGAGIRFCADMPNERWQADIAHLNRPGSVQRSKPLRNYTVCRLEERASGGHGGHAQSQALEAIATDLQSGSREL